MVGTRDDAARHALLAAFSHDLRAPLARLIQASGAPVNGDEAQYRAAVAACAHRQLALLDDLLDYTRHAVTPPEVVTAPAYLYALLDEAGREARASAAASGVAATIAVEADTNLPPLVMLDARLLRQVLRKLLACALGHADGRQTPVVLALGATAPASPQGPFVLRFSVGAAASGIAQPAAGSASAVAEVLAAGSGAALELAIADQLLRAAGSRLQREASRAGGAMPRFFFELGTLAAAEEDAMLPVPLFSGAAPAAGPGRRILVVDTAPAMLDYLGEVLEHGGFDVDRAASPDQALALHGDRPYALLVCAHQPPVLDAWDLLLRLGALPAPPPVLLHALTPLPRPDGLPAAPDFAAVLYRPAAPDLLLTVLAELQPSGGARR